MGFAVEKQEGRADIRELVDRLEEVAGGGSRGEEVETSFDGGELVQ
jgi:hypothetical protein